MKRKALLKWLHTKEIDIVMLQETHLLKWDAHRYHSYWFPLQLHSHARTKTKGVALMFRRELPVNIIRKYCVLEGRAVGASVRIGAREISWFSIYAPN